ncbi:FAD-dependent oxidoreductase [Bordetella genomosp. 13]|uniref:FAD-dependent oxidoreductase n=1 Tax=Bordetella genomosp. 13 TaxID=463040 RepID=UPI0011A42395|nr:FAD-dependent oxidoreductase [Bordetella genomosp. 13]
MQDQTYDVVVVGCGVAGLSAAVSAAESGARVVVLERAPFDERGGQSRYTEAYLRMKSETEVTDDFEVHLAENGSGAISPLLIEEAARPVADRTPLVNTLSIADPDVVETLAAHAGPTVAWMKGLGVRFDFLPTQFLTKTQPRLLPVGGGQALIDALAARAEALGAQFLYETSGLDLLRDEAGTVIGLTARTRKGPVFRVHGKVVLACGGFEGNTEMQTRYIGPRAVYLRPICRGGYYNRGDGIRMGLDAGAAPSGDFGSYHAEPVDPRSGIAEPSLFIFPYGILVNRQGRRFTDEAPGTVDAYYESVTRRIYEQEGGMAYIVLDARHRDIPNYRLGIRTDQPAVQADSIEALAQALSLPADTLAATVADFNAACPDGDYRPLELDGLATRGLSPRKSNWSVRLDRAPFYAYPVMSANVFTFGGLKTDSLGRVVDHDGEPIPNLYAAGEMTGLYYGTYTGSTSVLRGMVFGRLAGAHAAGRQQAQAA